MLTPIGLALKLTIWSERGYLLPGSTLRPAFGGVLEAAGYHRLGVLPLINAQAYRAEVYGYESFSESCAGRLYLVEMWGNEEAGGILANPPGVSMADHFFVFRGQIYDTYPAFTVWSGRMGDGVAEVVGAPSKGSAVYGVAVTSRCIPSRQLSWP